MWEGQGSAAAGSAWTHPAVGCVRDPMSIAEVQIHYCGTDVAKFQFLQNVFASACRCKHVNTPTQGWEAPRKGW